MNPTAITPPPAFPPETAPSPRKIGRPLVAWLVLLGIVGFIFWRNAERPAGDAASWKVPLRMQARYVVGLNSLKFAGASGEALYKQVQGSVEFDTFAKRLRLAVLAGELVGPEKASEVLGRLKEDRQEGEADAADRKAADLLRRLYAGYEKDPFAPDLTPEQQADLRQRLDWFGELALAPQGGDEAARAAAVAPARRTVFGMVVLGLGGLLALLAGGTLLVIFACLAALGRLGQNFRTGSGHGGVYVEMFVVYLLVFLGLGFAARQLPERWLALWVQGVAMLLSLVALAWPVLRGLTWRQVRADLGLYAGRQPGAEVACGVGAYLAAVPVLFAGVLVMLGLAFVQRRLGLGDPMSGGGPTHPTVGVALAKDWWVWLQVFVLACVLAPLVEEIMFRGALYRQLREASAGAGRVLSMLFSALASSFVFAVIHPQGWLAVPPLMGLAFVFALAREWRGSLLPAMVAHGINNGIVMTVLLVMAS